MKAYYWWPDSGVEGAVEGTYKVRDRTTLANYLRAWRSDPRRLVIRIADQVWTIWPYMGAPKKGRYFYAWAEED